MHVASGFAGAKRMIATILVGFGVWFASATALGLLLGLTISTRMLAQERHPFTAVAHLAPRHRRGVAFASSRS
jgi:hypothetical protein